MGDVNSGRFAGKRHPAKQAAPFAKKRTNVRGDEAGEIVGVLHSLLEGKSADVVAVVESHRAKFLQVEHAADVRGDRIERAAAVYARIALTQFRCGRNVETLRDVAGERIGRGRLVGGQIWQNTPFSER